MTLQDLLSGLHGARVIGELTATAQVRSVQSDSRAVGPGDVFVAVKGIRSDGHAFVQTAIDQGAIAVVVEREDAAPAGKVPVIVVASGSVALGVLVGRALGDPAKAMTLIGITGTNGKTTTTYLVESILLAAGKKPGVIGTVTYRWDGQSIDAPYTTPTPQVLHETFVKMRDAGCTHVVMEVSSIALSMDRVAGVQFDVAAFSNLTQDHLDVHGSMDAYRDAKRLLFADHLHGVAVVNVDDPEGAGMAAKASGRVLRVTAAGNPTVDAEIRVTEQHSTVKGIDARIATPRGELDVTAKPLIGHYNVENLALAIGIGEALELPHDMIVRGIAALPGVPGRVERVANKVDLDILVDYAHTPDALRNVLAAVRPLTKGRLICVFGCGGDRDPTKRPKMGAAVAELADLAVVTSDNPRTEEPRVILDQILPGVPKPFLVEVDRAIAIRAAIAEAVPGDVVVIAGKGHEDYQIVGTTKHHFDDREQAAEACTMRETRLLAGLARDAGGEVTTATKHLINRIVIDSRKALPGSLYVAIKGEQHDGHAFCAAAVETGAVAVMVEKLAAVDVPQVIVGDTRIALGKIARHHRRAWPGKIVAITGSAGKTTTKELTRAALAAAGPTLAAEGSLNNETGVPLTLLGLRLFHTYGVIEMGMRGAGQIEYLTRIAEPDVAVVVNAGSAHIELLGSTDAIAKAKGEIWLGLREGGTIVRPIDDLRLGELARTHRPKARHVTFGEHDADVTLIDYRPLDAGGALILDVFGARHEITLHLVGRHAAIDACAAIAAAHAAGASVAEILDGIGRARPPAMRGEVVELGGRKVIVDCYNANPASMAAALRALAERAHGRKALAVVGDMLELGEHSPAAHRDVGVLARELGLGVIALGDHAGTVTAAFGDGGEVAENPAVAAKRVLERTTAGDWILLKASRGMKLERVLDAIKETVR
ncbi:MAG: UDP-N-acetylmuramoyl-L-alanyl-D-glutamate--2,6-diaminopimelate ligase [Deltaproteobacteria bacterium]|nr:UDP-N-acetylmuramoyl-L-alanyl-D-glutamate--2,6-diaminopimelate ligase [Deltaproteobacteria bacterium]